MHDLHVIHRLNAERAGREAGHAASSGELIAHLDALDEVTREEWRKGSPEHATSLEQAFDRGLRRGREEE